VGKIFLFVWKGVGWLD